MKSRSRALIAVSGWLLAGLFPLPSPAAPGAKSPAAVQPEEAIPLYADLYIARIQKMGYRLDYSLASVAEVERFLVEEMSGNGERLPSIASMASYDSPKVVLSLGHYLGEVMLRLRPGTWKVDRSPGKRFWEWRYLKFKDGHATNPIQKVWERYSRREGQGLQAYLSEALKGAKGAAGHSGPFNNGK